MNHVVLIAFRGGGTVLPYRTPYDREVVFEHVTQCAKRHGDVRMELGGHHWTVSASGHVGVACGGCGQADVMSYISGSVVFCHSCARRQLVTGSATRPPSVANKHGERRGTPSVATSSGGWDWDGPSGRGHFDKGVRQLTR